MGHPKTAPKMALQFKVPRTSKKEVGSILKKAQQTSRRMAHSYVTHSHDGPSQLIQQIHRLPTDETGTLQRELKQCYFPFSSRHCKKNILDLLIRPHNTQFRASLSAYTIYHTCASLHFPKASHPCGPQLLAGHAHRPHAGQTLGFASINQHSVSGYASLTTLLFVTASLSRTLHLMRLTDAAAMP